MLRRVAPALLLAACSQQPPLDASPRPSGVITPSPVAIESPVPTSRVSAAPSVVVPAPFTPIGAPGHFVEELDVSVFQRGNIHTHTKESDGDSKVEDVYTWYRDHGYQFVAITDHNRLTDPKKYKSLERPGFVMIPGEEVTMAASGKPVHVNALCHKHAIGGKRLHSVGDALEWAIRQVGEQGGVALVNHPNYDWALTADDLPHAKGAALLEIWSGHPAVHTGGDALRPGHEAIWQATLDAGLGFAGVAVDDMHNLTSSVAPEFASPPGRGWIEVFAGATNATEICAALAKGRLVASNGVHLKHIVIKGDTISLWPDVPDATVEFIGVGGAALGEVSTTRENPMASYKLRGGETLVRARVTAPDGTRAWTQAYRAAS